MVIPENCFIFVSGFIVVIYAAMIYMGYKKGLLYELISFLYTAASVLIAWFMSPVLASLFPFFDIGDIDEKYQMLNKIYDFNGLLNTIAYFVIIFLLLKLLYILISLLVKSLNKIPVIGSLNQLLGGIFGILHATIIVLALSLLLSLPIIKNGKQVREKTLFRYVGSISNEAFSYLIDLISDSGLKENIGDLDINAYREQFKEWIQTLNKNDE
jgi:uncharacterized membrane protein required for colicin V production